MAVTSPHDCSASGTAVSAKHTAPIDRCFLDERDLAIRRGAPSRRAATAARFGDSHISHPLAVTTPAWKPIWAYMHVLRRNLPLDDLRILQARDWLVSLCNNCQQAFAVLTCFETALSQAFMHARAPW